MYGFGSATPSSYDVPRSIPGLMVWYDIFTGNWVGTGAAGTALDKSGNNRKGSTAQLAYTTFASNHLKDGIIVPIGGQNAIATISLSSSITTSSTMTFFFAGIKATSSVLAAGGSINHVTTNASGHLVVTDGTNTATSTGTGTGSGNTWAAVCTGAAAAVSFYFDGVLDSSTGTVTMANAGAVTAFLHDHAGTINGATLYTEIIVYNRALTATQITQLDLYAKERWVTGY